MTSNPGKDLRSLGDRLFDRRDLPIAAGLDSARPAANMIRAHSFFFATDTGVYWYSDGATWTAASNAFGPKVYHAQAGNSDTTSATTFGDCTNGGATVGPELTGLADGVYVLLYGALAQVSTTGNIAAMNVSVNGASLGSPPAGGDAEARGTSFYGVSTGNVVTLSGGTNALKAVYAVDSGAVVGTFGTRWLIAIKVS